MNHFTLFQSKVFALRGMLAVPYFEKALYELPDDQVTPDKIQVTLNHAPGASKNDNIPPLLQ